MKEEFFKKAETFTIKAVRNFLLNEQSKDIFINILLKLWHIQNKQIQCSLSNKKVYNTIEILKELKTIIDQTYPEYIKNDEYNWAMTILKLATPRIYIKMKDKKKANFPLYIANDSFTTKSQVISINKQLINEMTFKAFEEIAGVAFYGDKPNNPFVEEIAEKLNAKIEQMTEKETVKQLTGA